MSEKKYDWLRFWGPRDGKFMVNTYGALEDPRSEHGQFFNPQAKTLEELRETHCLALLGEPGTGKSEELKHQVEKSVERHPNAVLAFQLRDYQTDGTLRADIFGNPTISNWRNSDHDLYVYLDSLDEGLLR